MCSLLHSCLQLGPASQTSMRRETSSAELVVCHLLLHPISIKIGFSAIVQGLVCVLASRVVSCGCFLQECECM